MKQIDGINHHFYLLVIRMTLVVDIMRYDKQNATKHANKHKDNNYGLTMKEHTFLCKTWVLRFAIATVYDFSLMPVISITSKLQIISIKSTCLASSNITSPWLASLKENGHGLKSYLDHRCICNRKSCIIQRRT